MNAALQEYHRRMVRVLDHIDAHLEDDLDLAVLSGVAAFSKFHFHRQFTATFGMSVHRYVQLARLKRASSDLTANDPDRITDIAIDAGYDAPDAFARAFRKRLGQSPSSFRKAPDWASWLTAIGPLDNARSKLMKIIYEPEDVTIRDMPETPVAIMEHRGSRERLPETIQRFIAWRKAAGLSPDTNPTFNIFRSEREPVDPDAYTMDLCIGTDRPIAADDPEMKPGTIPAGRVAVLRVLHNTDNLEPAALYLYREWLPASGEEARDYPIYAQRHFALPPKAPLPEVVCEVFLPLK